MASINPKMERLSVLNAPSAGPRTTEGQLSVQRAQPVSPRQVSEPKVARIVFLANLQPAVVSYAHIVWLVNFQTPQAVVYANIVPKVNGQTPSAERLAQTVLWVR